MKALVIHGPKDLRLETREDPAPGPGQVKVRLAAGGICGSDLHYYNHGGFGAVRLKEPMILGHEVAGHIVEMGADVAGLEMGQLVAVSPSRPCHQCAYCEEGYYNQCQNMQFYGSAMPFPHVQGAFREVLVVEAAQCADATGLGTGEAAMAEPLAVALHAARRAGPLLGKHVLVTGCGPIGVLAIMAARLAGAAEVVAVDLTDFTLASAVANGADRGINTASSPDGLKEYEANKGHFDVMIEATGAAAALASGIAAMRPGGVIVQLGLGGDMQVPVQSITAKELSLVGSFRFHQEFFTGVELMRRGLLDVKPLITDTVPLAQAESAFVIASDRDRAMKMQIGF